MLFSTIRRFDGASGSASKVGLIGCGLGLGFGVLAGTGSGANMGSVGEAELEGLG